MALSVEADETALELFRRANRKPLRTGLAFFDEVCDLGVLCISDVTARVRACGSASSIFKLGRVDNTALGTPSSDQMDSATQRIFQAVKGTYACVKVE